MWSRQASTYPTLLPLLFLVLHVGALKGPPVLSQRVSPHLVVRAGDNVRLSCPVKGTPAPMLEWRKDGAAVSGAWERYRLRGSTLRVDSVTSEDAGVFVCRAVNGFGTKEVTTELFVNDDDVSGPRGPFPAGRDTADNLMTSRGRPPAVLVPKSGGGSGSEVEGAVGTRLLLSCVTAGYPQPEVRWIKDGLALLPSSRVHISGGQLAFSPLLNSDGAVYTCVANNVFGSANRSFTLRTTEPAPLEPTFVKAPSNSSVHEGDTAVLLCHVRSASKAHVTWLRRLPETAAAADTQLRLRGARYAAVAGAQTAEQGGLYRAQLTLPAARRHQRGVYVCLAANRHGLAGREAQLDVRPAESDPARPLLFAAPAAALVGCALGAVCCLQRRRTSPLPPGDAKQTPQLGAPPPECGRPRRCSGSVCGRPVRTMVYSSRGSSAVQTPVPPPPAPYNHRHFRHLDLV